MGHDFDVLVIGSGFGGSVAALRLTEKGYKVGVIEAGARFDDNDFSGGRSTHVAPPMLGEHDESIRAELGRN